MGKKGIDDHTLEELENHIWPPLPEYPTKMVGQVYITRKKRIGDMDTNDFRLLIGQGVGLEFLIPKAIECLKRKILEDALYYPGDLLMVVLEAKREYWETHPSERRDVIDLVLKSRTSISQTEEIDEPELVHSILTAIDGFTASFSIADN